MMLYDEPTQSIKGCEVCDYDPFFEGYDDEDKYDNADKKSVYVSMSIVDEYGQNQSLSCSYNWDGYRGIKQGNDLLKQLHSFLHATEFYRLSEECDIDFVVRKPILKV